jgi:Immunity protein 26
MTVKIEEGQIFKVPLNESLHALGVAARLNRQKRGKAIGLFAYFFGPYNASATVGTDELKAEDAVMRLQCSALYLHDGRWQLVGIVSNWKREDWPLPLFYRDDLLQGTVLVQYDDNLDVAEEFRYSGGDVKLTDRQSIAGSLAVEIMIRQKCNIPHPVNDQS